MLKNLLNLKNVQTLSKTEQQLVNGGSSKSSCPTYTRQECLDCGGYPFSNGCCLGTTETHACLNGNIEPA